MPAHIRMPACVTYRTMGAASDEHEVRPQQLTHMTIDPIALHHLLEIGLIFNGVGRNEWLVFIERCFVQTLRHGDFTIAFNNLHLVR